MGWLFLAGVLLFSICAAGLPLPQGGGGASGSGSGSHGQPQAGSPSTPGPSGNTGTATITGGGSGAGGVGVTGAGTGGGAGGGAAGGSTTQWSTGPARRGQGWRNWSHRDPTVIKGLWKTKGPLDSLGNAEVYIILALLIGFVTVVIGCWLSDNCWSPEPEGVVTLA